MPKISREPDRRRASENSTAPPAPFRGEKELLFGGLAFLEKAGAAQRSGIRGKRGALLVRERDFDVFKNFRDKSCRERGQPTAPRRKGRALDIHRGHSKGEEKTDHRRVPRQKRKD